MAATRSTPPSISPGSASAPIMSPRSATTALSDEMIAGWAAEGVGTRRVVRLPGKLPGLYMIQTDDKGERRFFHWRDSAAARSLMDLPQTPEILNSLAGYDVIYLSAITLSLYGGEGRARLFAALKARARSWGTFCFRYQFPGPRLARSRRRARRFPGGLCRSRYRAGFHRGFAAALSRRNQRSLAGADSGRRGGAEAFGTGEHPSSSKAFFIRSRPSRWRRPSSIPRRPATVLRPPTLPRASWARIRLKPRGRGIVWPALWYAIPVRSSRARRCRPASSRTTPILARHRHDRSHKAGTTRRHLQVRHGDPRAHHRTAGGCGAAGACAGCRRGARAGSHPADAGRRRGRQGHDRGGAGSHCRHRHDPERRRSGAGEGAWRQIRHQPRRDAGAA